MVGEEAVDVVAPSSLRLSMLYRMIFDFQSYQGLSRPSRPTDMISHRLIDQEGGAGMLSSPKLLEGNAATCRGASSVYRA